MLLSGFYQHRSSEGLRDEKTRVLPPLLSGFFSLHPQMKQLLCSQTLTSQSRMWALKHSVDSSLSSGLLHFLLLCSEQNPLKHTV